MSSRNDLSKPLDLLLQRAPGHLGGSSIRFQGARSESSLVQCPNQTLLLCSLRGQRGIPLPVFLGSRAKLFDEAVAGRLSQVPLGCELRLLRLRLEEPPLQLALGAQGLLKAFRELHQLALRALDALGVGLSQSQQLAPGRGKRKLCLPLAVRLPIAQRLEVSEPHHDAGGAGGGHGC